MHIEQFLSEIETKIPDIASTKDLVELGIFSTNHEALRRRSEGRGPAFIYLSKRRIIYPKNGVISWLRERALITQKEASKPKVDSV